MIPGAAIAMRDAIESIRKGAIEEMERRGKVATGRTMSTLSTFVAVSASSVVGTLEGEEQWQWVGNGRGPGRMPPIEPIQRWVDAKGVNASAWAIAKTIARRGSKDFREGKTNVFEDAMDAFERDGMDKLGDEVAGYFEQQAIDVAINNLKR